MTDPIKFSGKYIDYPGTHTAKHDIRKFRPKDAGKMVELCGVDLGMVNDTDRNINDFEVYTFPTSRYVDTPDFAYIRIYHKNRLVFEHNNMDEDGRAEKDLDSFQVKSINPAIEPGEPFRIQMFFEDPFDGEEGFVILGTSNCSLIGCNNPTMAVTPIPEGPDELDLIEKAISLGSSAAGFLMGKADTHADGNSGTAALVASVIMRSKAMLSENMLQLTPILAKDNPALMMVLSEIHARKEPREPLIFKALQGKKKLSDDKIDAFSAATFED